MAQSKIYANTESTNDAEPQSVWQGILVEANEIVSILHSWNPGYFDTVDPMCSYIVYLAASIFALNNKADLNCYATTSSQHVELASLFLSRVGQYWTIGAFSEPATNVTMLEHALNLASITDFYRKSPSRFVLDYIRSSVVYPVELELTSEIRIARGFEISSCQKRL